MIKYYILGLTFQKNEIMTVVTKSAYNIDLICDITRKLHYNIQTSNLNCNYDLNIRPLGRQDLHNSEV